MLVNIPPHIQTRQAIRTPTSISERSQTQYVETPENIPFPSCPTSPYLTWIVRQEGIVDQENKNTPKYDAVELIRADTYPRVVLIVLAPAREVS